MKPSVFMDWGTGLVHGPAVQTSIKRLSDIRPLFLDQEAARRLPPETELYRVQIYAPVPATTEGGLCWGNTTIQPGTVGGEYFMTKGHFHSIRNRGEYYATFSGQGALLLMDEKGVTRAETMEPGSVHYIPGHTAHRAVNTGTVPLLFIACWPSDAGHDYDTIEREGFSARMLEHNGTPLLVPEGK